MLKLSLKYLDVVLNKIEGCYLSKDSSTRVVISADLPSPLSRHISENVGKQVNVSELNQVRNKIFITIATSFKEIEN